MRSNIKAFFGKLKSLYTNTNGQSMIMVALALAVLLGFGALTTDVGYLFVQRRQAQNTADAAALAGAWVITEGDVVVEEVVDQYGAEHGISDTEIISEISEDGLEVEVKVNKNHTLFLANVLNIGSSEVGAEAVATRSLIFSSKHKDILPLGIVRYPEVFYRVDKTQVQNKHDDYYDLFDKNSGHELYSRFKDSPGILNDHMIKFLIDYSDDNGISTMWVKDLGDDMVLSDEASGGSEYPSWEAEKKLLLDIDVYKAAWEYLIDHGATDYDIKFGGGDTLSGNFGLIQLDGVGGGGTPDILKWIKDGYKDTLDNIIGESGNKLPSTTELETYIEERGDEAFIIGIMPGLKTEDGSIDNLNINLSNGNIAADKDEYVILHIKNMEITGKNSAQAILHADVVEVFYNVEGILPGEYNEELLPQAWLTR